MQTYTGKLTVRKSDAIDDWWCIERVDHENRESFVSTGHNSQRLDCSSRLGTGMNNCDIEGYGVEMKGIASAIESGGTYSAKRCEARTVKEGVLLQSPRNSMEPVLVTYQHAKELAEEIRKVIP